MTKFWRTKILIKSKSSRRYGTVWNQTEERLWCIDSNLRKIAKRIRKNHHLAQEFWSSGVHEAKILASLIDKPKKVTNRQMERWVVCDQRCSNLLDKTRPILRIKKRLNGVNETRNSSSERDLF